jgi:hypothetical protein
MGVALGTIMPTIMTAHMSSIIAKSRAVHGCKAMSGMLIASIWAAMRTR